MPSFKPAYLIHGDDHGRIGERRARLRAVAEAESGPGGAELLEGDAATPQAAAAALSAMTFALGRRFVIVDGAERWKDAEVERDLAPVLARLDPDTTVAFFAREDGRLKAPKALHTAVGAAGGDVACEQTARPRELPRWVTQQAGRLGLTLEPGAAQALVARVGERQQRLLRELEKLALEHGAGATVTAEDVEGGAARSAERQVWGLVDALVAGERAGATRSLLALRSQGESLARHVPRVAPPVREVLAIAERLEAGEPAAQVKRTIKGPPFQVDRRIAEARRTDAERLRRALEQLADLEYASRGADELEDDTTALRAVDAMTA